MNQRVDQQVPACVRAKKLAIDHVRNPGERMPIRRIKRGERPDESGAVNTAIHHRIFPDIRWVIQSDELMPNYLCVNPKRDCPKSEQDDEIGSSECCSAADSEGFRGSSFGCGKANNFSLLRCPLGHTVYETTRPRVGAKAFNELA